MSALVSPLWGLAPGSFPTFIASAGLAGTMPPGAGIPVRGQVATSLATGVVLAVEVGVGLEEDLADVPSRA
jgi:hypothetical protein